MILSAAVLAVLTWPVLEGQPAIWFGDAQLVPISDGLYADPATTAEERALLEQAYAAAREVVTGALGPSEGPAPAAIFCKTTPCREYFAGPASRSWALRPGTSVPGGKYVADKRPTLIVLRVDEGTRGVTAHEMVHLELAARMPNAIIPAWFDEGLAAQLSNAPDCSDHPSAGIDDLRRLDPAAVWATYTSSLDKQHPTYCQAKAEVARWLQHKGAPALAELLAALAKGGSFYSLYGPLRSCPSGADCSGPLGRSAAMRVAYFPLDEVGGAQVIDPRDGAHRAALLGEPTRVRGRQGAAVHLEHGAFVRSEGLGEIGVIDQPLTLSLWVRPDGAGKNVLIHGSANSSGGDGWCTPFLGFDPRGRLVGQILYGRDENAFLAAIGPSLAAGKWSHVAMTWSPAAGVGLYVNGARVAVAPPKDGTQRHFYPRGGGAPLFLTWGSDQKAVCWDHAIAPGHFDGAIDELSVFNFALTPGQIAQEAKRTTPVP